MGFGEYVNFFPCPYDRIVDAFNAIPPSMIPQPIESNCGCGCGGGCSGMSGLTMDGTGLLGTGLFTSTDIATWGAGEVAVLAFGFFALYSMFSTTRRAGRRVAKGARSAKRKMSRTVSSASPFSSGGDRYEQPRRRRNGRSNR